MRLTKFEIQVIIETFYQYFTGSNQLWLFGSRVDDTQKGGDIDLYIETTMTNMDEVFQIKMEFLLALQSKIGDQKIDVVIGTLNYPLPIYQHAKETGYV